FDVAMLKIICPAVGSQRNAVSAAVEITVSFTVPVPPTEEQKTGVPVLNGTVDEHGVPFGASGAGIRGEPTGVLTGVPLTQTRNLIGIVLPFLNTLEPSLFTGCSTVWPGSALHGVASM